MKFSKGHAHCLIRSGCDCVYGITGSVPRAVASVAPSRGRFHKPRSLPLAVLIRTRNKR